MTLKRIISYILFLVLGISAVCNILFLLNIAGETVLYTGFIALVSAVFLVSLTGFAVKNIKKEDRISINIITPAKEIGGAYVFMLIVWLVTYSITMIFK